jgi:N-succinyldiaminopimelate aminotransferase
MNPLLSRLHPYPFERLRHLFSDVTPNPDWSPVSLGIGEPRHPTPALILQALQAHTKELAAYPATAGSPAFRQACADWLQRRYNVKVSPATQILPVNGSREALFAFAQTVLDPTADNVVVSPNPFYQIYEGAALLGHAQIHYVASVAEKNFAVDWDSVPAEVWQRTRLLFVCSPGNPTGAVMPLSEWQNSLNSATDMALSLHLTSAIAKFTLVTPPLWAVCKQLLCLVATISNDWFASPVCPNAATYRDCAVDLSLAMRS